VGEILAQVQANRERVTGCAKHQFPKRGNTYVLGQKLTCVNCGGVMSLPDAASYLRGYVAHGGDASDIIPDWTETKP